MGVQAAAGTLAGAISGVVTTPLDVIKTRLQVSDCMNPRLCFLAFVCLMKILCKSLLDTERCTSDVRQDPVPSALALSKVK
jgi:hypothetical protein